MARGKPVPIGVPIGLDERHLRSAASAALPRESERLKGGPAHARVGRASGVRGPMRQTPAPPWRRRRLWRARRGAGGSSKAEQQSDLSARWQLERAIAELRVDGQEPGDPLVIGAGRTRATT